MLLSFSDNGYQHDVLSWNYKQRVPTLNIIKTIRIANVLSHFQQPDNILWIVWMKTSLGLTQHITIRCLKILFRNMVLSKNPKIIDRLMRETDLQQDDEGYLRPVSVINTKTIQIKKLKMTAKFHLLRYSHSKSRVSSFSLIAKDRDYFE